MEGPETWTNPSVLGLSGDDPVMEIVSIARSWMLAAADEGLAGPPFDPLALAKLLGIRTRARADLSDAALVVDPDSSNSGVSAPLAHLVQDPRLVLEYNPTRPRGRMRFSIAHELAHAMFHDASAEPRHRTGSGAVPTDDDSWQLELLCNVAAAELLMPTEAVAGLASIDLDIDYLMDQRRRFDVSTEALLRRVVAVSERPLHLLALHRQGDAITDEAFVEYNVASRSSTLSVSRGTRLASPAFKALVAVGQTERFALEHENDEFTAQAVGISPYPGRSLPRLLCVLEPVGVAPTAPSRLRFETGDISDVSSDAGSGKRLVIAHVTNDSARAWGPQGVAAALGRAFPTAKAAYRSWTIANRGAELGAVHLVETSEMPGVWIASLVAQRGYGSGSPPRLSYAALSTALSTMGDRCQSLDAHVRMPRIGTGQAGGRWDLVETEIDDHLTSRGIDVTVVTFDGGASR
jgi:Zn-dependent peptidase ImmA (M78 family)/O-acetyl-ADP-ribose deacetylase (regulator of RNase III)